MNNSIKWTEQHEPVGLSLDQLLYRIRQSDSADGLIFDSASMDDILSEEGVELLAFDALVFTYSLLRRKMDILLRTMNRAGGNLEVSALQVSDPFRRNGVAQVAAVFELSDGQTVSVYFHNPDSTPGKLTPKDEMISWKWLLNKKDITIVVAPERGNDIAIREVARRIMKLADRNSAAFAKNNAKRAERLENISNMKEEIANLESELEDLNKQIEIRRVEIESEQLKPKMTTSDGLSALESIKSFISRGQYRTISKAMRGEEKQFFIDKARLLADIINGMAETYEQDGKGLDATAYLHYFKGASDWYITEKDSQGGTRQAFGYADLGQGGELGYISIDELTKGEVELDLHFDPQTLSAAVGKSDAEPAVAADQGDVVAVARAMVAKTAGEFNGSLSSWEQAEDAAWDYAYLAISDLTLRIGVSAGGVVSIDGKPHDPEGRVIDSQDALRAAISALLPVTDLSWELEKSGVTAMDEEQFQAEIASLESDNLRSQSLLLLAKRKGSDEQIAEAQGILDEHDRLGHAPPELIQRRETLREALEQVKPDAAPASEQAAPAIISADDIESRSDALSAVDVLLYDLGGLARYARWDVSMEQEVREKLSLVAGIDGDTGNSGPALNRLEQLSQKRHDNLNEVKGNVMATVTEMAGLYPDADYDTARTKFRLSPKLQSITGFSDPAHFRELFAPGEIEAMFEAAKGQAGQEAASARDDLDAARENTNPNPTEAEKESGDYDKGELSAFGLDLVIENPKGHVRSGKSEGGTEWSVSMAHDYGYIKGTKGADGDEVDVFIGPNLDSETAYVIEQVDADGKLDEHKVMLGFNDEAGASQGYLSSYKPGWDGLGSIKEMSLDELKAWLPNAASANNEPQQSEQSTPEHELNQDPTPTDVPAQEVEPATVEPEPAAQAGESQVDQLNALKKLAPKTGEAVRSDDPDAIAKLEAKLNYLQSLAQMMRDANKHVRKGDIESLAAMGFNDKTIQALSAPDNSGRKGFAQYQMANNSSEVGRTKRRLKQLYREQEAEVIASASEPIEPTIEAEPAAEPIIDAAPEEVTVANDDVAFLESVANGAVADMLSPELGEQITAALERNIENESMAELLERAVMAYQSAAELATSDI